jgi:tetratricopeptide (TPR) repeat protein
LKKTMPTLMAPPNGTLRENQMNRYCLIAFVTALLVFETAFADSLPANQLPMYGEREKTAEMKSADAAFIASIEKRGLSHQEGAEQVVQLGWSYWAKRDFATAMSRFNQAWLLDPENGNVYHGFALVTSVRGGTPSEVERLFLLSISKPNVDPVAFVDYGRFLWTQKQLERSLVQLNKALQLSPTVRNARSHISFVYYLKGDAGNACTWAKDAQKNGDELEKGFLEDMCRRAGKL